MAKQYQFENDVFEFDDDIDDDTAFDAISKHVISQPVRVSREEFGGIASKFGQYIRDVFDGKIAKEAFEKTHGPALDRIGKGEGTLDDMLEFVGPAGTFGGIRGLYETLGEAGLNKVRQAEKLYKANKSRQAQDDIWDDLGMFKDVDGKWRFEIDDVGSKIKMEELASVDGVDLAQNRKLSAVFDHEELYKHYPELKDLKVTIDIGSHNKNDPNRGWQNSKEIFVRGNDPEDARSTLLHEIQHRIQDIEGFARGGNPEGIKAHAIDVLTREKSDLFSGMLEIHDPNGSIYNDIIQKAIQDPNIKISEIEDIYLSSIKNSKSPEVQKLYKMWKKHDQWLDQLKKVNTNKDSFKMYKNLLGEIEARNVQHRRNMTPERRKINHPILDDMSRFYSTRDKSPVVLQRPPE